MQTQGAEALVPEPAGPPAAEVIPGGALPASTTTAEAPPQAPVAPRAPRLAGVDLARGLAMLGMLAAHTAAAPTLLASDPATWGGIVHGRSSILFATLAGVSVALMTGRTVPPSDEEVVRARVRLLVRGVCLFLASGLVQLVSAPIAVILGVYGVLVVLLIPFLRWRSRNLFLLAGGIALVVPSLLALYSVLPGTVSWIGGGGELGGMALSGPYPAVVWSAFVLTGLGVGRLDLGAARVRRWLVVAGASLALLGYGGSWAVTQVVPNTDPSAAYASSASGSSTSDGGGTAAVGSSAPTDWHAPEYVDGSGFDFTGYGCVDYGGGTIDCTAPGTPGGWTPESVDQMNSGSYPGDEGSPSFWSMLTPDRFFGAQAHTATTPEVLGSGGFALLVLGLALTAVAGLARIRATWLVAPVVAIGSMSLTVYSAHIVGLVVAGQLSGQSTGGEVQPSWLSGSWQLYLVFALSALVLCPLYRRFLGRGPMERAMTWTAQRATRP